VKKSCKACFRKVRKLHTYENTSKPVFGKPFENNFGKYFLVFKDIVRAFFKRKAPKANATFNIFESQCPKIRILSKALRLNSLSVPNGVTILSMPCSGSTTHRDDARVCLKCVGLGAQVLWRKVVPRVCN